MLTELPGWQERLTEAALGQTRMSDNAGRKSARRRDIDGDAELASCIESLPVDDDLDKARRLREKAALAHALSTGGIDARASELLAEIADSLLSWCRTLCEARGLVYAPGSSRTLGAQHARWLRRHIDSITASEDAGDIAADLLGRDKKRRGVIDQIERAVNRPLRYWPLGQCPAETDDGPCEAELPRVPEHTEDVKCRDCGTRHVVSRVLLIRKHEREGKPQKRRELVRYNTDLPPEFQIPPRTLRHWLANGTLTPCGWDGEDPLYSWMDVRLLMLDRRVSRPADNQAG
jgi:hypothetical protein